MDSGLRGKRSSHGPGARPYPCECPLCLAGPLCKYKHTRRVMCANYLVGFCPEGPKCKFVQYVLGMCLGGGNPLSEAAVALAGSGTRT